MILTDRQIREGLSPANLSHDDLAAAAEVALGLIVHIEAMDGMAIAKKPDLAEIRGALEASGVEFSPENGGAGVCLRKSEI